MLIPLEPLQKTFWVLKDNVLLYIVALVTLVGGALLPDLDNSVSKAQSTLGPLGSIFTTFMQSTSSIVWTVYHFKGDRKPSNQHRYLWHTPLVGIGLILLFYFGLPSGNYTIFTNIKNSIETKQLGYFFQTNAILFLFIILSFMTALVGSNIILSKIYKLIKFPKIINYIFPVAVMVYIFIADYSQLRILGIMLGSGYLFHIIEDAFCDTGVPLLFPIPIFWKKQAWTKIKVPLLNVKTGGLANNIIDFIALFIAIGLMVFVFIKK